MDVVHVIIIIIIIIIIISCNFHKNPSLCFTEVLKTIKIIVNNNKYIQVKIKNVVMIALHRLLKIVKIILKISIYQ